MRDEIIFATLITLAEDFSLHVAHNAQALSFDSDLC
jgi:hypothetical protein